MTDYPVTITGTVGRDAEQKRTKGGHVVAETSVAVYGGKKDGEPQTLWVKITGWNDKADTISPLSKGDKVQVSGTFVIEQYNGKNGLTYSTKMNVWELVVTKKKELFPDTQYQPASPEAIEAEDCPF